MFANQIICHVLTRSQSKIVKQKGYSIDKAKRFLKFQHHINTELLNHRVITDNPYTIWFEQGDQSLIQIKTSIIQFSVFSNQFLIAQLNKMIHAETLESMRASKEILANIAVPLVQVCKLLERPPIRCRILSIYRYSII
jgi:hypothetical protein